MLVLLTHGWETNYGLQLLEVVYDILVIGSEPLDHFIFDSAQGLLQFDIDGSGDEEAMVIAHINLDEDSARITSGDVFVGI